MKSVIELLERHGLPPGQTGLARHSASQSPVRRFYREGLMDASMSLQNDGRFDRHRYLLSFIGFPDETCLFLGAYENAGRRSDIGQFLAVYPYPEHINAQSVLYRLEPVDSLSQYANRLLVRWGAGQRAWLQNATAHKEILQIYPEAVDAVALYDFIRKNRGRADKA